MQMLNTTNLSESELIPNSESRKKWVLRLDDYTFFHLYLAHCAIWRGELDPEVVRWILLILSKILLQGLFAERLSKNNVFLPILRDRWFLIQTLPTLEAFAGFLLQGKSWASVIRFTKEERRSAINGFMNIPDEIVLTSLTHLEKFGLLTLYRGADDDAEDLFSPNYWNKKIFNKKKNEEKDSEDLFSPNYWGR
jgi:hypothetical protein